MNSRVAIALILTLIAPVISRASSGVAGFERVTGRPADDTKAWTDSDRFQDIKLEAFIPFTGTAASASGSDLTANSALWRVDEFKYVAGLQTRHYIIEITSGTETGSRFDIISNSGDTVTVDLNGGSLAGISPGDGIQIIAKWSLNQLFPNGNGITSSSDVTRGSDVLFPDSVPGGVDFSTSATYRYRSDLGRWIDVTNPATDVGDTPIEFNALVVIRQSSLDPIQPPVAGFASTSTPLQMTISYLQEGHDHFANALSISDQGGRAVNTVGASGEIDEPQHGGNANTASVWLEYNATQSGTLIVRSEHSTFDSILAAYSGNSLATLQLLASNDDASPNIWSEISVPVLNGESYMIALDGKAGAAGDGFITWELQPGAPEITIEYPASTSLTDGSSTLNFGNVEATTSEEFTLTIANSGTAVLSGLATSLTGSDTSEFSVSSPANTALSPGQSTIITIQYQPGSTGSHSATLLVASNDADEDPFDISISGTGITLITINSWGAGHGLTGGSLIATADDDGDQISLLAEYAFNLDPNVVNLTRLESGTGTSGLPNTRAEGEQLVVEFIRRSSEAEMTAKAVFSDSPLGPFTESSETEIVTPIDDYYERVIISDSLNVPRWARRFAKVLLQTTTP